MEACKGEIEGIPLESFTAYLEDQSNGGLR